MAEAKTGMQSGSQMRITPDELALIKNTFGGNEALLKLMRKIFLPEVDANAPLGQVIDLWMTVDIKSQDAETAMTNLLARNSLIMHVDQQLLQLRALSMVEETEAEKSAKAKLNSAK